MGKKFDSSKTNKHILYLDANNLYGFCMTQYLPHKNFRFLTEEEITEFDIHLTDSKSKFGYILEVDLVYPVEIHEQHQDFPLAPEKLIVKTRVIHTKLMTDLLIHIKMLKKLNMLDLIILL